ncbi:MAG: SRPBCC domain-containing protein [Fimbriimonas sp.]
MKIERKELIQAPIDRVWATIGTAEGTREWFKVTVEGEWKAGNDVTLTWNSGSRTEIRLLTIEAPHRFAYQWHPGVSALLSEFPEGELTTVTFELRETPEGTELLLTETGFDRISEDRQLQALGLNTAGWEEEIQVIRATAER